MIHMQGYHVPQDWYFDQDEDGFGDNQIHRFAVLPYIDIDSDCDDQNAPYIRCSKILRWSD